MSAEPRTSQPNSDRFAWWREARFGLFIHWGLYALPAGIWQGREIAGIGEWIMRRAPIPVREYEQLAGRFNPVEFNAESWVQLAKEAGMRYIVITSKHHDGFALFDSKASDYDIVDATPFRRDPIAELAAACRKHGLRLGFYYSQAQDWHDPDADGNDWDYDVAQKDFARYFERKCVPQVREILTQYGPIGLIWFDTPRTITPEQSETLTQLVHTLQPDCLVNSRVGHGAGDYASQGDNRIPFCVKREPWETPATLNDTWGFKQNDHNWKPVGTLLRLLVDIAGKGGNYLLNVGPTALGTIPGPSIERLRAIGRWLKTNGEAIYGTQPSPFLAEQPWGAVTQRPGKLYLQLFAWPKSEFVLRGLQSRVGRAYLLADPTQKVGVTQSQAGLLDLTELRLTLPASAPDPDVSVIVLEIAGEPAVDPAPIQQPDGVLMLETCLADVTPAAGSDFRLNSDGHVENWTTPGDALSWSCKVATPGRFAVELWSSAPRGAAWTGGQTLTWTLDGAAQTMVVQQDDKAPYARSPHQSFLISRLGEATIAQAGQHTFSVRLDGVAADDATGLLARGVRLTPLA
ncbi:MAG TPA: alpha-L-fucosidase [Limnochordia bacterium]|nr:alpha-L-fucosidase [Limnochordia bacterium]